MKKICITLLQTCIVTLYFWILACPALATTPPSFENDKWQQMLKVIVQEGSEMNTGYDIYRIKSRIIPPDNSLPRTSDYMSAVGFYDLENNFIIDRIEVVSENWKINSENNWSIDQWLIRVGLQGDLELLIHKELIETLDGKYIGDTYFPVSPEEKIAVWDSYYSLWKQFLLNSTSRHRVKNPCFF